MILPNTWLTDSGSNVGQYNLNPRIQAIPFLCDDDATPIRRSAGQHTGTLQQKARTSTKRAGRKDEQLPLATAPPRVGVRYHHHAAAYSTNMVSLPRCANGARGRLRFARRDKMN